jgi:hypothetical protein
VFKISIYVICLAQTGLVSSHRANKKLEGAGFNHRHVRIQLPVVVLSDHCRLSVSASAASKRAWSGHSTVVYVTNKPTASDKRCWSDKIMPQRVLEFIRQLRVLHNASTEDALLSKSGPFELDVFRVRKMRALNVSQGLQTAKPEYSWFLMGTNCVAVGRWQEGTW